MRNDTEDAVRRAFDTLEEVNKFLSLGNYEMAHRASQIYTNIMLTVLISETLPEVSDLMNKIKLENKIKNDSSGGRAKDGTIMQ